MIKSKQNQRLGEKGKDIARKILNGTTLNCDRFDFFDSCGNSVKVKTQIRFYALNSFTISGSWVSTNTVLKECLEADRLLFLEYNFKDANIRLWECTDRKTHKSYVTRGKRKMICWDVSNMYLVYEYTNYVDALDLRNLSKSSAKYVYKSRPF